MALWRLQMPLCAYSCRCRQEFNAFLLMSTLQKVLPTQTHHCKLSYHLAAAPHLLWNGKVVKKHGISCRGAGDCACPGPITKLCALANLDPYLWSRVIWQEQHTRNKEPNLSSAEKAAMPDWHHTINQLGIPSPSTSRAWNPGELFFCLFWVGFFFLF